MNDQVAPGPAHGAPGSRQGVGPDEGAPAPSGQPYLHDLVSAVNAPAMAWSGPDGQIRAAGAQGVYFQDVRAINELVLEIGGHEPVPLGHDRAGGATSQFEGLVRIGPPEVDPRVLVSRRREVSCHELVETFTFNCYAPPLFQRRAELKLSCDLAGIAAVKSGRPAQAIPAQATRRGLTWDAPGRYTVRAVAEPAPDHVDAASGRLSWDISVGPGAPVTLSVSVRMDDRADAAAPVAGLGRQGHLPVPAVAADDERLRQFVEASLADVEHLLMTIPAAPEGVFVAAGAPWYLTLFGRDSLWAARMLLPLGTDLALGTLRALAALQGTGVDPETAEQPGKIPHEVRREATVHQGTGAAGDGTFGLPPLYYGTVDATPLWVCLLHESWRWGAAPADIESLIGPMQRCLEWMAGFGRGPSGFVSYLDELGRGLTNQGWKDSFDGVQFKDGRLAQAPLALCEVQGYCYQAATAGAELLDAFGLDGGARWREFAADLAARFRQEFWVEDADGPYPAIALDGEGRPVDSVASNMGHLLGTGILNPEEAELVSRRLLGPDLNCGFGLRTMARSSAGYNPLSYHCGSVWGHDTAIAIAGLCRTDAPSARSAAASLLQGLIDAAAAFDYQLPELYGGHQRSAQSRPLPYPAACHPQAWTAAASVAVLGALAGARPELPRGRLALAPVPSEVGLRRVDGLVLGGRALSIRMGPDGRAELEGAPEGLSVSPG